MRERSERVILVIFAKYLVTFARAKPDIWEMFPGVDDDDVTDESAENELDEEANTKT